MNKTGESDRTLENKDSGDLGIPAPLLSTSLLHFKKFDYITVLKLPKQLFQAVLNENSGFRNTLKATK